MLDPISNKLFKSIHTSPEKGGRGPLILMYHGTPTKKSRQTSTYSVTSKNFQNQIDLLANHGWTTQSISELADYQNFPDKTVIITFDDGYQDNYTGAFKKLSGLKMKATWFIISAIIGKKANWIDAPIAEKTILDLGQLLGQLKDMAANGIEIGSHSLTHADLSVLQTTHMKNEIFDSKKQLEDLLGLPVRSFAYPFGRYNEDCLKLTEEAGYQFACTVRPGWFESETNPYLLRRICINLEDSLSTFARKLAFADSTVHWKKIAQYGFNRIQSRFS